MIKRVLHVLLALLIFLASTGFSINMHFCHDHLIDLAVMSPAESCCGDAVLPGQACAMESPGENHHCEDHSLSVETAEDYILTTSQFAFNSPFQFEIPWIEYPEKTRSHAAAYSLFNLPDLKRPPNSSVWLPEIQAFLL